MSFRIVKFQNENDTLFETEKQDILLLDRQECQENFQ